MTRVVGDLLARSARLVPERAAVIVDGGTSLTFADLDARANAFAHGLRARGVEHGDRIALDLDGADWSHYVVAYFGALRLGAVALLTATRFPESDLARIVEGYRVVAVIRGPRNAAAGPATGQVIDVTTVESGQSTAAVAATVRPDDAAEVIFTSGTTARPRGVLASHANLTGAQPTWPTAVRANQPVAHALPLGSVAAQAVLLTCVGGQHTMVVAPRFTVAEFTALAHRHAATTVCLVPAMGHWLARADAAEVTVAPSVKGVSFSGAALPVGALPHLPRVFPNATFFNFYTSTETYPARVATRVDPARPESVGRPVGPSAVRVLRADGAESPPGTVGEIWLRAGHAPPRRLLDDGSASLVRDGWTRSGDLGYVDEDGYLYLTGRTADIVIVGGTNVSTGRVEQVLARHPAVAEAAVCGVDHPVLGQVVAAFVIPNADTTIRELREHARASLARPEVPAIIRLVEDLPRNAAGKVVKRELPALLDTPGAAEFVAPRTELERQIADIWARVLQLGAVGVTDNFFEIGGDSLAATRIAAALRDEIGMPVDTVAVLEAPSVAELAELGPAVAPGDQLAASTKG